MFKFKNLFVFCSVVLTSSSVFGAGRAAHVVVIVWDGMRPDFVTEQYTPNLFRLSREGVTFKNHHPVYVSTTEVNGTALATGVYPEESGIIANKEFRPDIEPGSKIQTESLEAIRRGDALTGGHYLAAPTVAEILHEQGMRTVIAGAKPVVLLHDRLPRPEGSLGINLFAGKSLPESFAGKAMARFGAFPAEKRSTIERDRWTTQALTDILWENGVPPFSLLWLSEPDHSQHETGPGSKISLAALKHSDDELAQVLKKLDDKKLRDTADVIVVSDHGFSTIWQNADLVGTLNKAGFHAARKFPAAPQNGDVMVIGNGGSVFLYVTGHDHSQIEKMVHCLQAQPFAGVILTREPVEGTFALSQVRLNSAAAPDIVLSLRWTAEKSGNGTPGLVWSDYGDYGPGGGMHGSLSPYDLHNTCIAAGPDFRRGVLDYLPTGNIDIARTVLWLLGVERKLSGRVLEEALDQGGKVNIAFEPHHLEASYRSDKFTWHQYLNYSEVNGVVYFDEGNGEQRSPMSDAVLSATKSEVKGSQ